MKCPHCGYEMHRNTTCSACGTDAFIFTRTSFISDALYNKALKQTHMNDLSGAIITLNKSILFNKNNTTARNLLGLLHLEVGHVGDALKHWVISASFRKEGNPAVEYLGLVQSKARILEKYNDAIKMYNQALGYLMQKSDDMALIQLKKAVELNPKFIDAMNLLALCHMIRKDRDKALVLIEKVLTIDNYNSIAQYYYQELFPGKQRVEAMQKVKKVTPVPHTIPTSYTPLVPKDQKSFGGNFHLSEILSFFMGVAISFAILYILIMPGATAERDREINQLKTNISGMMEQILQADKNHDDEIAKLQEQITSLEEQNQRLESIGQQQDKMQRLSSASELHAEGDWEGAANLLYGTDFSDLSADAVGMANELKEDVFPKAAKLHYDRAVQSYNQQDYYQAKRDLEQSKLLDGDPPVHLEDILYYSGLIAEAEEDAGLARQYYEQLLEAYPDSRRRSNVNRRLNTLE